MKTKVTKRPEHAGKVSQVANAVSDDLLGQVALVTGGAKRVGRAVALCLAEAGMDGVPLSYAGREEAASPATGLARRHQVQQDALVSIALGQADGGEARRALKKTEKMEKKA